MSEREVLVLQALEVAQHLGLAAEALEVGVCQESRLTTAGSGYAADALGGDALVQRRDRQPVLLAQQHVEQHVEIVSGGGLVEADADVAAFEIAQVDLVGQRATVDLARIDTGQPQGVEPAVMRQAHAFLLQPNGQDGGQTMDAGGDGGETLGAMIDGVEPGDVGQQGLGGTDVGGGLLAANVLLAGLHRHAQGGVAAGIAGDADDASGNGTLERVGGGEVGGMRAAVAHGNAETLGVADHDVGAQRTRLLEQHQAHDVGCHAGHHVALAGGGQQRGEIVNAAAFAGVLQQGAEHVVLGQTLGRTDDQFEAEVVGTGAHHVEGLRQHVVGDEEGVALRLLVGPLAQRHGFGSSGGLIEQ